MKRKLSLIAAALLLTFSAAGCSNPAAGISSSAASGVPSGLTGSVTISGSSALQPLVQAAADDLKKANSGLSITVNAGGSGIGLQNVLDKTVDIGDSDVFAGEKYDSSKVSGLVDHIVCVVGVAAVVNPNVKVTSMTQQQLIDVFTGKATNWKQVGGNDLPIVIINRPASSGTRSLFKKYALNGNTEVTGKALTEDNSGTLRQTVAQTSGAISYLAFSYLNDGTVKALSIDNVKPDYDNVYSGKYNIWGCEHMYTNGEDSGSAKALINYIKSEAFSKTITSKGYGLYGSMKVTRSAPAPASSSK